MKIDINSRAALITRRSPVIHKNKGVSFYFNDIKCTSLDARIKKVFYLKNPIFLAIKSRDYCYIDNLSIPKYQFYSNVVYPHTHTASNSKNYLLNNKYYYPLCVGLYSNTFQIMMNEKKFLEMIYYVYDFFSEYNPSSVMTDIDISFQVSRNKKRCTICKKYNPYSEWIYTLNSYLYYNYNSAQFKNYIKKNNITICDIGKCINHIYKLKFFINQYNKECIISKISEYLTKIGVKNV